MNYKQGASLLAAPVNLIMKNFQMKPEKIFGWPKYSGSKLLKFLAITEYIAFWSIGIQMIIWITQIYPLNNLVMKISNVIHYKSIVYHNLEFTLRQGLWVNDV